MALTRIYPGMIEEKVEKVLGEDGTYQGGTFTRHEVTYTRNGLSVTYCWSDDGRYRLSKVWVHPIISRYEIRKIVAKVIEACSSGET
jgi:hypothetical protein